MMIRYGSISEYYAQEIKRGKSDIRCEVVDGRRCFLKPFERHYNSETAQLSYQWLSELNLSYKVCRPNYWIADTAVFDYIEGITCHDLFVLLEQLASKVDFKRYHGFGLALREVLMGHLREYHRKSLAHPHPDSKYYEYVAKLLEPLNLILRDAGNAIDVQAIEDELVSLDKLSRKNSTPAFRDSRPTNVMINLADCCNADKHHLTYVLDRTLKCKDINWIIERIIHVDFDTSRYKTSAYNDVSHLTFFPSISWISSNEEKTEHITDSEYNAAEFCIFAREALRWLVVKIADYQHYIRIRESMRREAYFLGKSMEALKNLAKYNLADTSALSKAMTMLITTGIADM